MNLAWVALLGIIVLGEKYAPARWHAERYVAALLTVTAAFIALRELF
jgi:predicted metal-binding membrane protein